ncbi:MAG: PAS domain-containing protein [Candidatus Rokubacteria bacterium]|nr:PAS domain-containing protein [Candidatus Rokubacteria bacterium]
MTLAELVGDEYPVVRPVLLGVAIINIAFGLYVYAKKPANLPNRMFAAFAGSIALWTLGLLFIRTASSPPILDRLAYVGGSLLVLSLLALFKSLPSGATFRGQWDLAVFAVLGLGFALLSLTPLIYRESVVHAGRHQNFWGPLYPVFGACVLSCYAASVATLWRRFRHATGLARLQLQYLLLGFLGPSVAAVVTNLLVPLFAGTVVVSSYGPLVTIPLIGAIAHAIIRHRLMDIRVVIRDGTVYALTGLVLATPAVLLVVAVELWIPAWRLVVGALTVGTVAVLAAPLRNRLHRVLNAYVYRERYDYHQTIREATERMGQLQPLDTLLSDLRTVVDRAVRPEVSELWLPAPDGSGYRRAMREGKPGTAEAGGPATLSASSALASWLALHRQLLLRDDPPRADAGGREAVAELAALGAELAVPISADEGLGGILLVGPKRSGDPYFDEDLALLGALAAEAAVALANARLHQDVVRAREQIEAILETMPSAVVAVNRLGQIEWFNAAAERLTGLSAGSVRERGLPVSHPISRLIRATLADGQPRQEEVEPREGTGPRVHLVCSVAPFLGARGEVRGAVCVGSDLSRVKELEAETRRVERLATFGAMASGIAHEIRNPLVAIKTHFQLLPEACTCTAQDDQRQFAAVATREIDRIDTLLERLIETRDFPRASFAPVDLREVVTETLLLLQPTLSQGSVTVVQALEPDCWVRGDREQLKQLCLNLLVNAKEAVAESGEIRVRCRVRRGSPRATAVLEIADTGPGIAEAVQETLFQPFVTTKRRGTGLGLALCRAIADVHRGTIRAENRVPGPGAVFTVELPTDAGQR